MSNENEENNLPEEEGREEMENNSLPEEEALHGTVAIKNMYEDWFLDYASYVIMERAVPALEDGLKPVQRRILHAMREMHDGRFHKVANIIGQTMQYHPHGDAAIGDALVNLGQKELLIETQGNWGDTRTGDGAAAPRYIEARLSKFALDVSFNPEITEWQLSYDGRKKEPVNLPVKFPLILAQGVEGIAVGLATKIMPHNFRELLENSINYLKGRRVELFPDFPNGGMIDVTNYNEGQRGGKIRVRCHIEEIDKRTLVIRDVPYGTTTSSLIDSILKANDNGKIKVKKVVDNTARNVEIFIYLPKGSDPDITIDALYAFTDCEVSISPNCCVITENKPQFLSVNEILKISTDKTVALLKKELEIKLGHLKEKWHFSSLEKIFIENRIYRDIEECETWEAVIETIDKGLDPYKKLLFREVTRDDIIRLTEIKIKRISKFDGFKADELIRQLEEDIEKTKFHLENIIDYSVDYFQRLLKDYGKGRERKTELRSFENIDVQEVAVANQKLYVNREEGFVGTGLKKDEFVVECSEVDDVIVFRRDGKYLITKVSEKAFVGKDILYVNIWKRNDERTIYNAMYVDGKTAVTRAKRFAVTSATRDREYDLTKGTPNSRVLYFSHNPNSEAEVVSITLSPNSKARKKVYDYDFGELDIKGRGSQGNIVSKYTIKKVKFKEKGEATLGGVNIWYLETIGRLNTDERGTFLGSFDSEDQILVIYRDGTYELTNFELTNRYEPDKVELIKKFVPEDVITAIYYHPENKDYFVKRFQIETLSKDKKFPFIEEGKAGKVVLVTTGNHPRIELTYKAGKEKNTRELDLTQIVDVRGWKAVGNRVTSDQFVKATLLPPLPEDGDDTPTPAPSGDDDNNPPGQSGTPEESNGEPQPPENKATSSNGQPEKEKKEVDNNIQNEDSPPEKKPSAIEETPEKKTPPTSGQNPDTEKEEGLSSGDSIEFDIKSGAKKIQKKKGGGESQMSLFGD